MTTVARVDQSPVLLSVDHNTIHTKYTNVEIFLTDGPMSKGLEMIQNNHRSKSTQRCGVTL